MSMFLPDGQGQAPAPFGAADSTPSEPETTSGDIALMQRVLAAASRNPNLIPADFMAYVLDWIQTQRLQIPIGQVPGFFQFTPVTAPRVDTSEGTTSAAYTDLTTPGPSLNQLPDGQYLFIFSAALHGDGAGNTAYMSLQMNSDPVLDADAITNTTATDISPLGTVTKTLKNNGSNTVTARYRVEGGGSAGFRARSLIAFRYGNA